MKANSKDPKLLLIGMSISTLLVILFLYFKSQAYFFMDIDVKWLVLASIQTLLALFWGGFVKSFKGLGIELESNLNNPLPSALIEKIFYHEQIDNGIKKDSLESLYALSDDQKNKITRIKFIIGLSNYYDAYATQTYLTELNRLQFIEIINEAGEFLYLLPIKILKNHRQPSIDFIEKFIKSIETSNVAYLSRNTIKDYIFEDITIIEAYRKVLTSVKTSHYITYDYLLPVLNSSKVMIGIIYKSMLETKIAEEVVKTTK